MSRAGRRRAPGRAWTIALVLAALGSVAEARPRGRAARAAFDRGVTAYQKGNYEAAAAALGRSFELERDSETLYAWAQAERLLDRCDKAIELYEKLLSFKLVAENREAVEQQLAECRELVAPQKPAEPAPVEELAEPPATPTRPPPAEPPRRALRTELPPEAAAAPSGRSWYTDPLALGLLGGGLIATGAGAGLLVSARSLDADARRGAPAFDYDETVSLSERARSRGNLALITGGAGAALLLGGIVYVLVRDDGSERPTVTGWLGPAGGGLAVAGGF